MLKGILNTKESKIVAGNYGALLLIQAANFILPLIVLPYLVRTLGTEKYGVVMIAQSLAIFLTVIVDFGFNISATREVSIVRNDKEKVSQLFWNVISIKIILVTGLFFLVVLLIQNVTRFYLDKWVYILSYLMVFGQSIFPMWFYQGIEKMKIITLVNVSAKIIFTASIFLIVLSPEDYEYVPLLHGGGFIIAGVFGFLYALRYIEVVRPNLAGMKQLISESSALFASNFATSLYTAGNTFILGMIGGDAIAGVYSSMEKLVLAFKNVFAPLYQAIFPWMANKTTIQARLFIKKLVWPITMVAVVITGIFFVFNGSVLDFIYADVEISANKEVLQILCFIALFSALNMMFVSLFFPAMKAYSVRMIILILGGLLNLIAALIGASYFGITGVAFAASSTELFILLLALYFYRTKKFYSVDV